MAVFVLAKQKQNSLILKVFVYFHVIFSSTVNAMCKYWFNPHGQSDWMNNRQVICEAFPDSQWFFIQSPLGCIPEMLFLKDFLKGPSLASA